MFKKLIIRLILISFFFTSVGPLPDASAQSIIDLPAPGVLVNKSQPFEPLELKGILVNVKNPLRFDFLVDKGNSDFHGQPLKDEIVRLTKYFLTCLAVPEDDLWVNLSPYEKDRIVPGNFGITLMGKDLLEQDYLLKQMMASLSYPENELGKRFWQRVYRKSYELYGTTEIPINTFNKVWILPKSADVYVQGNGAFVVKSQLDVMLEADYKSFVHHEGFSQSAGAYSQVFRDVIIPELRQEINEGKNFAPVRQVYNSMILATWYKRHLKDSLLGRFYVGKNQVRGVDVADKNAKEQIFRQYLKAYKKCVYNYIKEDYDPTTQQTVPRKYASGGMYFAGFGKSDSSMYTEVPSPKGAKFGDDLAMATVIVAAQNGHGATVGFPAWNAEVGITHPFHQVLQSALEVSSLGVASKKLSQDQAMRVPKFLRPLVLSMALAIGGIFMSPSIASAVAPAPSNGNIAAGMSIQGALNSLDTKIVSYQQKIHQQEGLLNILGILGDSTKSDTVLSGLVNEKAFAQTLLSEGKSTLDGAALRSLEEARLKGEIANLDQQIKIREQKIQNVETKYSRNEIASMHAGQRSLWQGEISYDKGVLEGLNEQKNQLSSEERSDEPIQQIMTARTVAQVIVSNSPPVQVSIPNQTSTNNLVLVPVVSQIVGSSIDTSFAPIFDFVPTISSGSTNLIVSNSIPASQVIVSNLPIAQTNVSLSSTPVASTNSVALNPVLPVQGSNIVAAPIVIAPPVVAPANETHLVLAPLVNQLISSSVNAPLSQISGFMLPISLRNTNASVGAPPPPREDNHSEVVPLMKSTWPLYTSLAVLGFGVLGIGGALVGKRSRKKAGKIINGVPQVSISPPHTMVIESSSQPPLMTAEEKVLLPQLKAQLNAIIAGNAVPLQPVNGFNGRKHPQGEEIIEDNNEQPKVKSSLSDAGAWLSGMVLSAYAYSLDPMSLFTAALSLPVVNAVYSTANTWIHEVGGHALAASILYPLPKYWKKSLRPSNWRGNFTYSQWKDFFISKLRGKEYQGPIPHFLFPSDGWRDWVISKWAIAFTVGVNATALAATLWEALEHTWMMPLLGVVAVKGYSAIKAAWEGDKNGSLAVEGSDDRLYPCGISMHTRFGKRKELARQGDEAPLVRMNSMIKVESDRGRHQVGVLCFRPSPNGRVGVSLEKSIELLRGPKSNSVDAVTDQLRKSLPPIRVDAQTGDDYIMDTFVGHNRLASANLVKKPAAHPHIGPVRETVLWNLSNGSLVEGKGAPPELEVEVARPEVLDEKDQSVDPNDIENVVAGIAHNGDSDEYQPLATDRYIKKLDELRALAIALTRYKGELAPGDSPVIALLIQYHMTQADPYASVNFAHNQSHHITIDELKRDLLTEEEEIPAGKVFNRGVRKFAGILSRPGLVDPEKTLKSLYVSKKMAEDNPDDEQIQFQYAALGELKKYLFNEYKRAARAGQLSEKITQHWDGPNGDEVLDDFLDLAIYKFFTGDREAAVIEFQQRSKGTYGLTVKDSKDLNGVTLVSRKLGMFFGVNLAQGYLDASSDPYALLKIYTNGDKLEKFSYLDPQGMGEVANFQLSRTTGKLRGSVFSLERNAYIDDDEMFEREAPLVGKNRYNMKPIHQYQDENRRVIEDMDVITPALARLEQSFDDSNAVKTVNEQAFNYQSAMEVFKTLLARWINEQINEKMLKGGEYKAIYLRVNIAVKALAKECASQGTCSEAHKQFLNTESQSTAENSILMAIVSRWMKESALRLATMRMDGEVDQKGVGELIPQFMQTRVNHLIALLSPDKLERVYKYWDFERKHPSSGKEKIGMLFAGDETSEYGPRNAQGIWDTLLPHLPKRFISAHEILDYQSLNFDIRSPDVTLLTSKAGGNYDTMQDLGIMDNAVGLGHVWGVTNIPFSPLSFGLKQKVRDESRFGGHVFYLGDHYSAQTQGASETLTSALHNNLAIFVALQFEKYCPGENPFGLNLTPQKVEYLTRLKNEMMLRDAKHITGRDEEGLKVSSPVNEGLVKRGKYWATKLRESAVVTLVFRLFVYGIFLYMAPIHSTLVALNHAPGPALHSLSGFLTASGDFLLTMLMPWLITLTYRKFTKYNPWVLLGAPANINFVGLNSNPDILKMMGRVIFSRAFAGWSTEVHAEIYQKAIAELVHAKRGSWIIGHLGGATELVRRMADGAFKQLKVTRVGIFGSKFKRTGPISFTTSRGAFEDLQGVVSDSNIDLGGTEFNPPDDDDMKRVYNVLDAWGATLAVKEALSVMADSLTFKGKFWDPSRKVNNALSLTTEKGQPPPDKMPIEKDSAQISRHGGIDMNSRLMQLNIKGETSNNRLGVYDSAMSGDIIKGVVPQVSGIVTVTPDMLKAMLGAGYLN